jgi:hypothetical protein
LLSGISWSSVSKQVQLSDFDICDIMGIVLWWLKKKDWYLYHKPTKHLVLNHRSNAKKINRALIIFWPL